MSGRGEGMGSGGLEKKAEGGRKPSAGIQRWAPGRRALLERELRLLHDLCLGMGCLVTLVAKIWMLLMGTCDE